MEHSRGKRGRLSSLDLLPDEAFPHVRAAIDALAERRRTQDDIREELNTHLLALGLDPVSRSAFNRKALQLAVVGEKIRLGRELAAAFAEKQAKMPEGDVALLINETVKTLIFDLVMNENFRDSDTSAKMMKEVSLALYRLEQARKISHGTRFAISATVAAQATEQVDIVAKAKGLSAETAEEIKAKILGIVH
jgi:hypothetical protein